MNRRQLLKISYLGISSFIAGCSVNGAKDGNGTGDEGEGKHGDIDFEERVLECEEQYIRNDTFSDNATLDTVDHSIIATDSRSDGAYIKIQTYIEGRRQLNDDEPEEHFHGEVTAYYLVSDGVLYRTEDADSEPQAGAEMNC